MEKIDWKTKLSSRKFWAAVTGFVSMLIIALGGAEAEATRITALIMAGASVIAYIIGEGLVDANRQETITEYEYMIEDDQPPDGAGDNV